MDEKNEMQEKQELETKKKSEKDGNEVVSAFTDLPMGLLIKSQKDRPHYAKYIWKQFQN